MPACFSMVWALRTQCAERAHCWSPSRRLPLQGRLLLPQSSCLLRHTSLRTNDPVKCLLKRAPSPNFVKAGAGVVKGGGPQLWNWVLCNIILLMCLFFCLKLTSDLPPKPQPSPCTLPCAAPPPHKQKEVWVNLASCDPQSCPAARGHRNLLRFVHMARLDKGVILAYRGDVWGS